MPDSAERAVVAPPSEMNDQTFIKHMNARHKADLAPAGFRELPETTQEYMIGLWRSFHKRVHDGVAGKPPNHDHRGSQATQAWQDPERK